MQEATGMSEAACRKLIQMQNEAYSSGQRGLIEAAKVMRERWPAKDAHTDKLLELFIKALESGADRVEAQFQTEGMCQS
jgi:hypothetical protein